MNPKKSVAIVDSKKLIQRVDSLKFRSKDVQAKLAHTLKALWKPSRKLAIAKEIQSFDSLKLAFPHFDEVIDLIEGHAAVSHKFGFPFQFPPILLLGEPGVGKTFFVSELAKCLEMEFHEVSMSTMTASFVLSGGNVQWGDAEPGFIAKTLAHSNIANPLILIDEIDKASRSGHYSPMGPLYNLLEKHSARKFKDEALELEINASHINWILTANYIEGIPAPIISRMMIFNIPLPNHDQMQNINQAIYQSLRKANPHGNWFDDNLDCACLHMLGNISPRSARMTIEQSMMNALIDNEPQVMPKHIKLKNERKARVGFI